MVGLQRLRLTTTQPPGSCRDGLGPVHSLLLLVPGRRVGHALVQTSTGDATKARLGGAPSRWLPGFVRRGLSARRGRGDPAARLQDGPGGARGRGEGGVMRELIAIANVWIRCLQPTPTRANALC